MWNPSILQVPLHAEAVEFGYSEISHTRHGHICVELVRLSQGMVGEHECRGHHQPKSEGLDHHACLVGHLK
uniref:Uncharacterized protein n=1 Tax=Triticum urartu TaxID=4572 RepID=A0A8R7UJ15_TRIUA